MNHGQASLYGKTFLEFAHRIALCVVGGGLYLFRILGWLGLW